MGAERGPPSPLSTPPLPTGTARSCSSRSPASPPRRAPYPVFQVWHPSRRLGEPAVPQGHHPRPGATAMGTAPAAPRRSRNKFPPHGTRRYPERFLAASTRHREVRA